MDWSCWLREGAVCNGSAAHPPKGTVDAGPHVPGRYRARPIIDDEEVKPDIVRRKPYRSWVTEHRISLDELPDPINVPQPDHPTIRQRQQAFGYTIERLMTVICGMVWKQ